MNPSLCSQEHTHKQFKLGEALRERRPPLAGADHYPHIVHGMRGCQFDDRKPGRQSKSCDYYDH